VLDMPRSIAPVFWLFVCRSLFVYFPIVGGFDGMDASIRCGISSGNLRRCSKRWDALASWTTGQLHPLPAALSASGLPAEHSG